MNRTELRYYLKSYEDGEEPVTIDPDDTAKIELTDIPKNISIQVAKVSGDNVHHIELEGTIGWENKQVCILMSHNWYRKWWDLPLGMPYHMDLMKRLVEFRQNEFKDIKDIDFKDDGDWCHLYYTIIPKNVKTLYDVYKYGLETTKWINEKVDEAQNKVSLLLLDITQEYSKLKLIEIPELIKKISIEKDANIKGRLLEELICKLFSKIKGFKVISRVRTSTEEIDLVILNNSPDVFWQKESPIVLVECKNWSKKTGKNEFVVFKEKILNRKGRAKIGFFISWNGFCETFKTEDLRISQSDILIVPVEGKEIIKSINDNNFEQSLESWWLRAVNL